MYQQTLTKEDIKNSVAYQWRKSTLKWMLFALCAIALLMTLTMLATNPGDMEYVRWSLKYGMVVTVVYVALFAPFALYHGYKMRYLLKNYEKFGVYEVMLDQVSTSYSRRGACYYTVTIRYDGQTRKACTQPYFPSRIFAQFPLEEYNNQKVIGLYDDRLDKFYVLKKV